MVSKEELEDILHDEEVEKNWKSIKNSKRIRKAQADEKFWREHLDPYYDEMFPHTPTKAVSDVVNKEIEEYKLNDPILKEFDEMLINGINRSMVWGIVIFVVGLYVLISMITTGYEESCLSC